MDGFKKIVISRFNGGLNNAVNPFLIGDSEWQDGRNVVIMGGEEVDVRPGFRKMHNKSIGSDPIMGLFRYYKKGGSAYWVCASGDSIYYFDGDEWVALGCDLSLNSNQRFRFRVYGDLLLLVNGSNHAMFWDGNVNHNVHRLGVVGPSSGPSGYDGSSGSGSLDTGVDYWYKFTYYNSDNLMESNPSEANAAAYQTTTGQIIVTIPQDANIDSQVDKIRLYRTEGGAVRTDSYYLVSDYDIGNIKTGDIQLTDNLADSQLGTECDWSDRYYPGYGGGTDFKYIEVMREMTFLAGESTNPSRLYYSHLGYPERFSSDGFFDIGKDDGDKISGLIDYNGSLLIFKERSIWAMHQPYDPNRVNIVRLTQDHGCIAPDSLVSDGNVVYFVDVDGIKGFDGRSVKVVSERIGRYFREDSDKTFSLPVRKAMRSVVWNRKMMISFSSLNTNYSENVIRFTTEYTTDSGNEKINAELSSDYRENNYEGGVDARKVLSRSQSSANKRIDVEVYIPFDDSQMSQHVYYSIFFSYDGGVSWVKKLTDNKYFMNYEASGSWPGGELDIHVNVNPIRHHIYSFYDEGVTDVRLDLHDSFANALPSNADNGRDDANKLTYIKLMSVGYYYDDSSFDMENDRVLVLNLDSGKWDAVYEGFYPNCWAVGDRANDLYELYFGSSRNGYVYQYGVGDYDDGDEIIGWFQTKHFSSNDLPLFFDRIRLKYLAESGELEMIVFADMVERLRRRLRAEPAEEYYNANVYQESHYGGSRSLIEKVVPFGREGKYLTLMFVRKKSTSLPLLEFSIEGKVLEE